MTRMAITVLVLTLCTSDVIKASDCEALTVAAPQIRTTPMVLDKLDYSTNDAKCHVVAQFVEAVAARQAATTCQGSASRQSAFKIIAVEIETFHDRSIAEQSCVQMTTTGCLLSETMQRRKA
jgi:hypothetical protein